MNEKDFEKSKGCFRGGGGRQGGEVHLPRQGKERIIRDGFPWTGGGLFRSWGEKRKKKSARVPCKKEGSQNLGKKKVPWKGTLGRESPFLKEKKMRWKNLQIKKPFLRQGGS